MVSNFNLLIEKVEKRSIMISHKSIFVYIVSFLGGSLRLFSSDYSVLLNGNA